MGTHILNSRGHDVTESQEEFPPDQEENRELLVTLCKQQNLRIRQTDFIKPQRKSARTERKEKNSQANISPPRAKLINLQHPLRLLGSAGSPELLGARRARDSGKRFQKSPIISIF